MSGIEAKVNKMEGEVDKCRKELGKIENKVAQQGIASKRKAKEKLDEIIQEMEGKKGQTEMVVNKAVVAAVIYRPPGKESQVGKIYDSQNREVIGVIKGACDCAERAGTSMIILSDFNFKTINWYLMNKMC